MGYKTLITIIISSALLTILSCQNNTDKSLIGFFDQISNEVSEDKVISFKNSEIDSAGHTLQFFYKEMTDKYNKYGSEYNLGIYSDSIGREWQDSIRIVYLTIAYHLYCNRKETNFELVQTVFKKMSYYQRRKHILESAKEDDELANMNTSNFNIGDKLSVCLLIDNDISVEYQHYYCGAILSDEEYFSEKSTHLSGILLSKSKGEMNPTGRDLIFHIKVLDIDRENVMMSHFNTRRITRIGDTVDLNVTAYRRLIGQGTTRDCSQIKN